MSPNPNNYSSINASRKHGHSKRGFTRPNRLEALRLAIFSFVLATSLIALGLSAHFLTVLQANDLTHFIPFALFTSVASIIGMVALVAVVLVHKSKPAALKVELGIMAVIGILWLALSIFISTSPAESADVQCFTDEGELLELEAGPFGTAVFHAQFRVLVAIGSVNAFILLIVCAVLTFMALRHFNRTRDWVSTTRKPLLGEKKSSKSRERSRSFRPAPPLTELPKRVARKTADVTKGKDKSSGLPLPATARGASRSNNVSHGDAAGNRPPAPPPRPTPAPVPKRPPIAKSKTVPTQIKDRPSTSKALVSPAPLPRAKVAVPANGAGRSAPQPVVRRKTHA